MEFARQMAYSERRTFNWPTLLTTFIKMAYELAYSAFCLATEQQLVFMTA
jgi:hypothetical protein